MLVTPFFSCSAKIPIYVLFAGMFFPKNSALVAFSLYVIGFAIGIFIAWISHILDRDKNDNQLLIELPEYKRPSANTIFIYVWTKIKDYLQRAGTIIFISSIVMPYSDVDKIAKMVPKELNITLDKSLEMNPDLRALYESDEQVKYLINMAKRLEGLPRNTSMHGQKCRIPGPVVRHRKRRRGYSASGKI